MASSKPPWCVERVKVTVRANDGRQRHFDNHRLRKVKDHQMHERYGVRLFLHDATNDCPTARPPKAPGASLGAFGGRPGYRANVTLTGTFGHPATPSVSA
ncbi:hypothetical protein [Streptomyces bobili]|uniref:hypothetical protein n=1 Tax=Streptomyces bobili TaxID=67280 RepID=UPI0037B13E08